MDVLQVFANVALQFIFFGVNLILLPALVIRLTESFANDFNPTLANIKIWLRMPLNWALVIILTPIRLIFGNFKAVLDKVKLAQELCEWEDFKTPIVFREDFYDNADITPPIYNVWRQIGYYIEIVISVCVPSALTIMMVYFLLPETYSIVASEIGSWTAFQSGTPNLNFFINMALTFKNIMWDGFIIGALNENILLLILVILLAIFVFGVDNMNVLYGDVYYFNEGVYEGEKKRIFYKTWKCLPTLALVLLAFNFIFALINYQSYVQIASMINSIGMIVLLVILVQIIITLAVTCPRLILNSARKRD